MSPLPSSPPGRPPEALLLASEWRPLLASLVLATSTLFGVAILFLWDPGLAITLLTCIGMHATASRGPAVLFCLARGLSPGWTLLFNFYVELILVLLTYYAFILVVREGIESRFLKLAAKQAEAAAQESRGWVKRFEVLGLFLFVLAPLPATGPVTGAIAGYLLNLRPWVTFATVMSASGVAQAAYTYLGKGVVRWGLEFSQEYRAAATEAMLLLIAAFLILHVRSISKWVQGLRDSANGK